jgi:hypothetical protein
MDFFEVWAENPSIGGRFGAFVPENARECLTLVL